MKSHKSNVRIKSMKMYMCLNLFNLLVLIVFALIRISLSEAQIVSHELRRLATASNQFGIDSLKALDRIEPPDKVLVFCPVCLSSSLMMIMMGSSKYQVVSAMRQALYVWSMKPHEINRGFRDIFDHIGLNQQQFSHKGQQVVPLSETRARNIVKRSLNNDFNHVTYKPSKYSQLSQNDLYTLESESNYKRRQMSLPKLIQFKEMLEQSDSNKPWWQAIDRSTMSGSRHLKENIHSNPTQIIHHQLNYHNITDNRQTDQLQRDVSDMSQMNAISNIYIQRGLSMNYNYNLLLRQYYRTIIHPVDFFQNGEETRQHINSLVASNTEGKIKDLVKRTTFENITNPRIMIISTFHFRGTLDIQIKNKESTTTPSSSRIKRSNTLQNQGGNVKNQAKPTIKAQTFIETEESLMKYGFFPNLDCTVVEIPFNNRLISLVVVMPNQQNSTELLISRLSAQVLSDMVNSLSVKKISIEIPVIKFDRGPINVEGVLKELGLDQCFFGDRLHTTETGLNKWMRPLDIVHETSIDIGTINPKFGQPEDRLKVGAHDDNLTSKPQKKIRSLDKGHIRLDKPFFYFVLDSLNGLVLTMGRIRQ